MVNKKEKINTDVETNVEPENLTYRLSLTDSANRAVQCDMTLEELTRADGLGERCLMDKYADLLQKENDAKVKMAYEDEQIEKKLKENIEKKQEALPTYICQVCKEEYKGGDKCPDIHCQSNLKKDE